MAQFSISDAAFTGFGVVRHKPVAVAIWVIVQLLVSACVSAVVIRQFGPLLQQIADMSPAQSQDPAQAMAMLRQMLPLYGYGTLFALIFYPILFATMNRAVLRPNDDAFGYIRLGADEMRQLGLMLIFILLGIVGEIVLIFVTTIVVAVIGVATHAMALARLIALPIVLCALIFLMVRFSLASAQTFATRKINVFGSWSLTKGRFWPIFGAYLVAFCLLMIVTLLGYVVIFAAMAVAGGGQDLMGAMMHPRVSTPGAYFSPARVVQLGFGAVLSAITWPIMATPAPAIYRAIMSGAASPTDAI